MDLTLKLTPSQIESLRPVFGLRGTHVLVCSVHPDGNGWSLAVHPVPAERREAIRAACSGTLKLPRHRSRTTAPAKPAA